MLHFDVWFHIMGKLFGMVFAVEHLMKEPDSVTKQCDNLIKECDSSVKLKQLDNSMKQK